MCLLRNCENFANDSFEALVLPLRDAPPPADLASLVPLVVGLHLRGVCLASQIRPWPQNYTHTSTNLKYLHPLVELLGSVVLLVEGLGKAEEGCLRGQGDPDHGRDYHQRPCQLNITELTIFAVFDRTS